MGRRKNNPELVQELMDGHWTMPQEEYEQKFNSLSASDRSKVSDFVDEMGRRFIIGDFDESYVYDDDDDDDDGDGLDVYDAAEIWASHGKDEDYTFGYTEEELEEALDD